MAKIISINNNELMILGKPLKPITRRISYFNGDIRTVIHNIFLDGGVLVDVRCLEDDPPQISVIGSVKRLCQGLDVKCDRYDLLPDEVVEELIEYAFSNGILYPLEECYSWLVEAYKELGNGGVGNDN